MRRVLHAAPCLLSQRRVSSYLSPTSKSYTRVHDSAFLWEKSALSRRWLNERGGPRGPFVKFGLSLADLASNGYAQTDLR